MHLRVPVISPLQSFLSLLGEETLESILTATNAYALLVTQEEATHYKRPRPWYPLTRNELIVWLGTLFFTGRHHEVNRECYWQEAMGMKRLNKIMAKTRWEQIHRFFKINPKGSERQPGQSWYYELGPDAPTQQVPSYLCEQVCQLIPEQQFIVFLDNLFLNVNVAHCLLAIGFAVMGTTRKNAIGLPTSLTDVLAKDKEAKKDDRKKQPLAYNSVLTIVMHKCLCFLWQDNNSVLAITTAHSLHQPQDRVQRERKRPSSTSTNARQAYACFEEQSKKELSIPVPIDDYNRGMNGVDIASQIQRGFFGFISLRTSAGGDPSSTG